MAQIVSDPYADPKAGDDRRVVVKIHCGKKLARPVTLSEIKADGAFEGWELLRIGRLSVMPVPPPMWERIEEMGRETK
jgi:predicted RNA-binding protein with PUA-like domain